MQTNSDVQVILLGESGVGKTSLLLRFVSGLFRESLPRTTIDSKKKVIKIKDITVNLVIWDTAGQEMYNSLVRGYYRLADGVILVYDVQSADTFLKLSKWLVDLKKFNEKAEVLIAGSKSDDQSKKSVNISMVKNFACAENIEHVEVSSKSGTNVDFLFRHLVKKILAAKGILTFSKSCLLERLARSGEYIAPSSIMSDEHSSSLEDEAITNSEKVPIAVSEENEELNAGLEKDYLYCQSSQNQTLTTTQLREQRDEDVYTQSAERADSDIPSAEFADTDTDSAECALQFFETFLAETEILVVTPEQRDVIKLSEAEARNNKRTFCLI